MLPSYKAAQYLIHLPLLTRYGQALRRQPCMYARRAGGTAQDKECSNCHTYCAGTLTVPASSVAMLLRLVSKLAKVGRLAGSCAMQVRIRRASCGGVFSGGCSALFSMATTWMTCTGQAGR